MRLFKHKAGLPRGMPAFFSLRCVIPTSALQSTLLQEQFLGSDATCGVDGDKICTRWQVGEVEFYAVACGGFTIDQDAPVVPYINALQKGKRGDNNPARRGVGLEHNVQLRTLWLLNTRVGVGLEIEVDYVGPLGHHSPFARLIANAPHPYSQAGKVGVEPL